MNECKKGTSNIHLTCNVCKIDFNSNADFALHEFSKKHCDNLIKLTKQRTVTVKQKTKNEVAKSEKQPAKINLVTHSGSFAKYGYFVPGENYINSKVSKEFNTDYDPYIGKFSENTFKEKAIPPPQEEMQKFSSLTSFKKIKERKIKKCQVCDVAFVTLPEYEAHMKSPQHIWKLKVTGMGVSAHFVKASSDLHTTDVNKEDEKVEEKEETAARIIRTSENADNSSSGSFPLLYCSDCELLFDSPQQYNTHISGKFHSECAQKKAESKAKKEMLENPCPGHLFCYSCEISLNNLNQYNEHKYGKKHKTKCTFLIRRGITIPPEERFPGLPSPNPNKPVVYPELYEKFILEKEKLNSQLLNSVQQNDTKIGVFPQLKQITNEISDVQANYGFKENKVKNTENPGNALDMKVLEKRIAVNIMEKMAENNTLSEIPQEIFDLESRNNGNSETFQFKGDETEGKEMRNEISIITDDKGLTCSICSENFEWQSELDSHLGTEQHLKKILALKLSGKSESEILDVIFSDRKVVKPDSFGKFTCSICNITADNSSEFNQHLTTIVHKYTEKDYRKKRTVEVKNLEIRNENELYFCRVCEEGWLSLVDYTQHLHLVKHRSLQRAHRAKVISEKRKNQRSKNLSELRVKRPKSLGVRTKVRGVATDLSTSSKVQVSSLDSLEPKIDNATNVSIGIGDQKDKNDNISKSQRARTKVKKRQLNRGRFSFIPSAGLAPPLMPCSPFPRYPRANFVPNNGVRVPFSSPRPPLGPFRNVPPLANPHFRPQRFLRPPWPRNRLRFPH